MNSIDNDMNLLVEYNQWVTTQGIKDTSPEAFMKDRMKEVALDRIENALNFINDRKKYKGNTAVYDIGDIQKILEGTWVYDREEPQPPEPSHGIVRGELGATITPLEPWEEEEELLKGIEASPEPAADRD